MSFKWLRLFFDPPNWPTKADQWQFFSTFFIKFWLDLVWELILHLHLHLHEFEIHTAIFWLTRPTNQSRPIANLFIFCGFCPILIRFGLGANIGLKMKSTYIQFEMNMAIFRLTKPTDQSRQHERVRQVYQGPLKRLQGISREEEVLLTRLRSGHSLHA